MRIATVTDDGVTISAHFGRADRFVVVVAASGVVLEREVRAKPGHDEFVREGDHGSEHEHRHEGHDDPRGHGFGRGAAGRHARMIEPIRDCDILLARGMGRGAAQALREAGIEPITTDILSVDEAIAAVLRGEIEDRPERRH